MCVFMAQLMFFTLRLSLMTDSLIGVFSAGAGGVRGWLWRSRLHRVHFGILRVRAARVQSTRVFQCFQTDSSEGEDDRYTAMDDLFLFLRITMVLSLQQEMFNVSDLIRRLCGDTPASFPKTFLKMSNWWSGFRRTTSWVCLHVHLVDKTVRHGLHGWNWYSCTQVGGVLPWARKLASCSTLTQNNPNVLFLCKYK